MSTYLIVGVIVQGIVCAAFCHRLANSKGHDAAAWAFGGLLFSVFALIAAAGLPDRYVIPECAEEGAESSEEEIPIPDEAIDRPPGDAPAGKMWECRCGRVNLSTLSKCAMCGYTRHGQEV